MSKRSLTAFITAACLMLGGCNNTGSTPDSIPSGTNRISAPAAADIDPNEPSYLEYIIDSGQPERFAVSPDGKVIISTFKTSSSDLIELSPDGTSRKIGECPSIPEGITYMGDDLYVLYSWLGDKEGIIIRKIGLNGEKNDLYAQFDLPISMGRNMSGNESELYIIAEDKNKGDITCNYPNFWNNKLSVFRVADGNCEKLPVDFPTAICAEPGGGALIAGCDDNGYYIMKYKDGSFSEKMRSENIKYSISAIADVDGEHIVFGMNSFTSKVSLYASEITNITMAELIPGMEVNGEKLYTNNGYCYFQPSVPLGQDGKQINKDDNYKIVRIRFSDYYKYNAPMNLICSRLLRATPFGCGYTINAVELSDDETALKILSQDRDYDLCCTKTTDTFSYSIKKQGSFYPLNDVPGVSEYLDKCLPPIKEAFTDENGDVWALPLFADTDFIFSNTGDTDYSQMKLDEFLDYMEGLPEAEADLTNCDVFMLRYAALARHVMMHDSFDTAEFRAAAERMKNSGLMNHKGTYAPKVSVQSDDVLMLMTGNDMIRSYFSKLYEREYRVSGLPCISESNVIIPDVTFLSVNPASDHLSDALDYIERLTSHQLTEPNTFIFKEGEGNYTDSGTVKQMIGLCENAQVHFSYPWELYYWDFIDYLNDKISLDNFITEADRKLKTYLNE